MPRVVFFGSPDFAVPSLKALHGSEYSPALVVTQPDRPSGRGRKTSPTPVRKAAVELGLPVMVMESFRDGESFERLASLEPDLFIVAAFGLIFPKKALSLPAIDCINVHASLLPRWRGASPINMAVAAGDSETGVSIMRMVRALDAGPVYAARKVKIGPDQTAGELFSVLAEEGASLLVESLDAIVSGRLEPVEQPGDGVTFAPLLNKRDGRIDWNKDALSVHNHIRGMNPWPGSYTETGSSRIKIHRSEPWSSGTGGEKPGTVLKAANGIIEIACGDGSVRITVLQAEGRRPLPAEEFLRGSGGSSGLKEGVVLGKREDEGTEDD
jgi:methionyl-tRNA formyltransferase